MGGLPSFCLLPALFRALVESLTAADTSQIYGSKHANR